MDRTSLQLVIFDCDGVLVDSEMLSAGVLMSMMNEAGFPLTPEIFRADFLGRSFAAASERARDRFGRPLPEGFQQSYRQRLLERMAVELRPMEGVLELLASLDCDYCLATSSSPERLHVSLEVTGLAPYFAGRSFTASEVKHGKPAPDLFLHAALCRGVAPAAAIVIEDSEMGIRAARAAGMEAWQFRGGAHVRAGYELPADVIPDRAVSDMAALRLGFAQLGLCRDGG